MNANQHAALMALIVPETVRLITERQGLDEIAALRAFVCSGTYAALEDEQTKVWHFSPETLYAMFAGEQATGRIAFPEEA